MCSMICLFILLLLLFLYFTWRLLQSETDTFFISPKIRLMYNIMYWCFGNLFANPNPDMYSIQWYTLLQAYWVLHPHTRMNGDIKNQDAYQKFKKWFHNICSLHNWYRLRWTYDSKCHCKKFDKDLPACTFISKSNIMLYAFTFTLYLSYILLLKKPINF